MRRLMDDIAKVAPTNGRVLITGESGTGKELVARSLHALSTRSESPFVMLNCAAIPSELIESELFGYEKGAFTGAAQRKKGLVELANNGTLFLDEVGDMGPAAQAKVLRVLQTGEFSRLGSEEVNTADVRVISATNKDISAEISSGRFRDDLYYRLNVIPILVPPLRDRAEDVPRLVSRFIADSCDQAGLRPKGVSPDALDALCQYQWPGNVRELKNLIERLVIMTGPQKMLIELQDIPENVLKGAQTHRSQPPVQHISEPPKTDGGRSLKEIRGGVERDAILKVLEENDWNVSKAATALGIERTNLHKKMKTHGIQRP
jgi:transcriptional regulator with GAF, ATPase, and Fis domain